MDMAVAYDLLYHFMNEQERKAVRDCMKRNVVLGCHKGYVEDNLVITNISNWIAHITGGSILCQAAMYGDGEDTAEIEPYFTGVILKNYSFIKNVTGDEAFGEGYVYFNYSMLSWAKSLPAVERVFRVDLAEPFRNCWKEFIWSGIVQEKRTFYFGDSNGRLQPSTKVFGSCNDWSWLLEKYKVPLMGWFYNHLKDGNTFMDVLHDTRDVPQKSPYDENPVKEFKKVGTTVFKSGWEPDDFIFVMHTGPFFNHQHHDQGTFWLSDRGSNFIEERHGSSYYADPLYQSWYTQPIAHSTILIDRNFHSQRIGDTLDLIDGFDDHAFIYHFLDGHNAAFTSGDIGRVYWGKVKDMKRNVLYLKPRTLIMLDTVIPAERDVNVTLLYQTAHLKDINAGIPASTITKNGNILHIIHLAPEKPVVQAVETPHYLNTLKRERPLIKEGMLTVTARTNRLPLVMANILTTTTGDKPDVVTERADGYISGSASGTSFAFTTRLNSVYETGDIRSDALALTRDDDCIFAALCTSIERDGVLILESVEPVTCEITRKNVKYYLAEESEITLCVPSRPESITLNGKKINDFRYDTGRKAVVITIPAGEGIVAF